MHRLRALVASISVLAACTAALPAAAQEMYPGQDVTVGATGGNGVLLYPGGKYGRVVYPLLQPGDPYPGSTEKPIHLHMPYRHVARHVKPHEPSVAVAATEPQAPAPELQQTPETQPVPEPQQAVVPRPSRPHPALQPVVARVAQPAAAAASLPFAVETSAPSPAPAHVEKPKTQPQPVKAATAAPTPAHAAAEEPQAPAFATADPGSEGIPFSLTPEPQGIPASAPTRVAKAEPPPRQSAPTPAHSVADAAAGMTKQSQIIFATGVADPAPDAIDAIKGLASPLNSALAAGAERVQVVAYGGTKGDKSSDARRLSLKRALIIRQLLIDGGVPSERIDVRAMGGSTDDEPADRVDIFTKA